MAITAATIGAANPGDVLRDAVFPGLHLRCFARRKVFYLSYRNNGRERRPKLGDIGVLSLADARRIARDILAAVAAGQDPAAEKAQRREAMTVAELAGRYLATYAATKKERSRNEDERLVKAILLRSALRRKQVPEVETEDVESLHDSLRETPFQANRLLALLSKMFNLAEKWKQRPIGTNPCKHIGRYREPKRKRYMTASEGPRIAELLEKYTARYPRQVAFIYLLIFTGARPDEIARARPEQITANVLHHEDSKTGPRDIYLPPAAMAVIANLPRSTNGTITGIKSAKHLWNIVRMEARCADLRMYDLRHSFASAALSAGATLPQIGELLGHKDTATTSRYAHLVTETARATVAATAEKIAGLLSNGAKDASGVVEINSAPARRRNS